MTRFFTLFIASFLFFTFTACSDSHVENEIRSLEARKTELQNKIQSLQVEVDSLRAENEKMQKKLSELDMN